MMFFKVLVFIFILSDPALADEKRDYYFHNLIESKDTLIFIRDIKTSEYTIFEVPSGECLQISIFPDQSDILLQEVGNKLWSPSKDNVFIRWGTEEALDSFFPTSFSTLNFLFYDLKCSSAENYELDMKKAQELQISTFYFLFQQALEEASFNHERCVNGERANSLEISPILRETKPNEEDYIPNLFEQYTNCYKNYAKDSLTLICQKEKELSKIIDSLEYEDELAAIYNLELIKKQLNFIVGHRLSQEAKGSHITAKAYRNSELVDAIYGSEKTVTDSERLSNLSYGLNSCHKIIEE